MRKMTSKPAATPPRATPAISAVERLACEGAKWWYAVGVTKVVVHGGDVEVVEDGVVVAACPCGGGVGMVDTMVFGDRSVLAMMLPRSFGVVGGSGASGVEVGGGSARGNSMDEKRAKLKDDLVKASLDEDGADLVT